MATPAKKTAQPTEKKPAPPAFNFASLVAEDAPAPRRVNGRARVENPTIPWLQESWAGRVKVGSGTSGRFVELGKGKKVIIPAANLVQFRNLLNYAANHLGIGVTVETKDLPGGKVQVLFAGKTRKQKKDKPAPTVNQPVNAQTAPPVDVETEK